jgi:hypothetical protein
MKVQKKKVTNPVCSQQFKAVPQQKRIISTVKENDGEAQGSKLN